MNNIESFILGIYLGVLVGFLIGVIFAIYIKFLNKKKRKMSENNIIKEEFERFNYIVELVTNYEDDPNKISSLMNEAEQLFKKYYDIAQRKETFGDQLYALLKECHNSKYKKSFYKTSCNLCYFTEACKKYHKSLKEDKEYCEICNTWVDPSEIIDGVCEGCRLLKEEDKDIPICFCCNHYLDFEKDFKNTLKTIPEDSREIQKWIWQSFHHYNRFVKRIY